MGELTPMMRHYLDTKEEYKDCIIFYRLGDFYEMFFEDAKVVSKELELTLTKKSCGLEERAPMCGVPYHAADTYLNRLVKKGYKVAICEQVEDPKEAKGMVKREVIRIVTPGTNIDAASLDETKNNYIMSIVCLGGDFGISLCDITTGDFLVSELNDNASLIDEIAKFTPSEILCNEAFMVSGIDTESLIYNYNLALSPLENHYFEQYSAIKVLKEHFKVDSLGALGLNDFPLGASSAGGLLTYLIETQKSSLNQLNTIKPYVTGGFMLLDTSTRRNLELTETIRDKEKKGSLLGVLDKTKTAMGARTLRGYIEQPLINPRDINNRLDVIDELNNDMINREEIREYLTGVYDLERLMTRVSYETANPRDLIALKNTIKVIPDIISLIKDYKSSLFTYMKEEIDDLTDIYKIIDDAIDEEPPITVRDGEIVKSGYNKEVDKLRNAKSDGKNWLAQLETGEREKTGIKNLKVKYNKVFGYYLEVTNSYLELVPDYFIRKQTLVNCERFFTNELKDLENTILNSQDKLSAIEYDIYKDILSKINDNIERIQKSAKILAMIDVFTSLSYVSEKNHYTRPAIND
ncbi:MAG: DNA mismatch repair protein MutS, partial [Lachnospiraceae bacterium]|nr:DNA mismatch repair protein MutS [Lachnospiraceae bacterium]